MIPPQCGMLTIGAFPITLPDLITSMILASVLNCVAVDLEEQTATGYLSPPSRSITKLYNFAAIDSWAGDGSERLHGGTIVFRGGYGERSVDNIGERLSWEETPLRCLHTCFLRRSHRDPEPSGAPSGRPILEESAMHDRSMRGGAGRVKLASGPDARCGKVSGATPRASVFI